MILVCGVALGKNKIVIPSGYLVYGEAQGLYKINLRSCQIKQLYSDQLGIFTKISKMNNQKFLFLQDGPEVLSIKEFDLSDNSTRLIYKLGASPYYNAVHKVVFLNYIPSYEEGPYLYVANFNNSTITGMKKITKGSSYTNEISVIPVSNDEVVFNYMNSSSNISYFNITTGELKQLPINNCQYPHIWRSKTKQLMCFDTKKQQYFFTDLSGKNVEDVKIKSNFLPILYLPEYDEFLYTKISFGFYPTLDPEKGSLWIYDFASGKSQKICDNIKIGTGDAAYYEE